MKIPSLLTLGCACALPLLSPVAARAQGNGAPGGFDLSKFDPAKIQQRLMDGYRKGMDVSDDSEWKVIEPLVQKVLDARRDTASLGGMGLGGMASMFGGAGQRSGGNPQWAGLAAFLPPPNPVQEGLKKAVDSKASNDELKAALAKFAADRKQKQANLEKAQAELREVLSVRQEAGATLAGLL